MKSSRKARPGPRVFLASFAATWALACHGAAAVDSAQASAPKQAAVAAQLRQIRAELAATRQALADKSLRPNQVTALRNQEASLLQRVAALEAQGQAPQRGGQ